MVGVRKPLKMDLKLMPATVISLTLHCMMGALLFFCLKERSLLAIPQSIISVDIRYLDPGKDEKPRVVPRPAAKPEDILSPGPPMAKTIVQKPPPTKESDQLPELPHPLTRAVPVENSPAGKALQVRVESPGVVVSPSRAVVSPSRADTAALPGKVTPPAATEPDGIKQEHAYLAALKEIIERNREYPLMARRGRMEGTVRIRCVLGRSGELMDATVDKPSGYTILDNAALRAVRSAGPYPRVPAGIKGDAFSFVAPIAFRLAAD